MRACGIHPCDINMSGGGSSKLHAAGGSGAVVVGGGVGGGGESLTPLLSVFFSNPKYAVNMQWHAT